MTTIIILFLLAGTVSLIFTPLVVRLAHKWKLLDQPTGRKMHRKPIPAIGGISIFGAFYLSFAVAACWSTVPLMSLFTYEGLVWIVAGTIIAFGVGFWDDIHPLGPWIKLFFHGVAALTAVTGGGVRIDHIVLPGGFEWVFGGLSGPITVFWIVVVMNAMNLIDGLDGLAAGLGVIVSMVLLVLCMMAGMIMPALILAALSGASFGFLRYNYHPAAIFMGNCGSYFLGFIISVISVMSSIKSQAAVTIFIPMIVMTVPLTDTFYAVIRRLIVNRKIFTADKGHIHHRLIRQGFSTKLAVTILYGLTLLLGIGAILLVFFRDERAGLLLLLVGVIMVLALGRMDIITSLGLGPLQGWFFKVVGKPQIRGTERFSTSLRRNFNDVQSMETLWKHMKVVAGQLNLDQMDFCIQTDILPCTFDRGLETKQKTFSWRQDPAFMSEELSSNQLLKLNIPLFGTNKRCMGAIVLYRNVGNMGMDTQTFIQVEQFRRALVRAIENLLPSDS